MKKISWTSLVAQWLRICLLMQGTWVQSLAPEDSTCCWATNPLHHKYSAHTLEPMSNNCLSLCSLEPKLCNGGVERVEMRGRLGHWGTCAPQIENIPHSPQLGKACSQQWRPSRAKNFKNIYPENSWRQYEVWVNRRKDNSAAGYILNRKLGMYA